MIIQENISLADKNWFRTGGNARYFCEPTTDQEFAQATQFAQDNNLEIVVIGEGANILVSDQGVLGLVIRPALKNITIHNNPAYLEALALRSEFTEWTSISKGAPLANPVLVTAGAGVSMPDLINYCLDAQIIGLEEFSGIPGTVGGSIFINIHYFQYLLSQFLVQATVINRLTNNLITVDGAWFNFGYNQSTLQSGDYYLVDATFILKKVDALQAAYAQGRRDEIIRHRNQRYPASNTCGSFFRNFHSDEIPFEINGKKVPYVAYYLDKIGVKGALRMGNAVVSYQHANMLVTQPGAVTQDVIDLAKTMQNMVKDQFGIVPQSECRFIGFEQHPLL